MDLVKLLIFAGIFVLLVVLGRILSARAEAQASQAPSIPESWRGGSVPVASRAKAPAATGAEIGFPITVPPVMRNQQGHYNRPYFINYYFGKTDLQAGPPDPECFYDDFHLQAQNPEDEQAWEYEYTIATPAGLQQMMKEKGFTSLYFDAPVVIVSRWDLRGVLQTVVDEIMQSYGSHGQPELFREPERWA